MIYQRHIPEQELFIAQLETLMQNGRVATLSAHLVGVIATLLLFWQYLPLSVLLLWAAAFIILLLLRSLQMSNALVTRKFQTSPRRVYWQLIAGALLTGAVWATIYIYAAQRVPALLPLAAPLVQAWAPAPRKQPGTVPHALSS